MAVNERASNTRYGSPLGARRRINYIIFMAVAATKATYGREGKIVDAAHEPLGVVTSHHRARTERDRIVFLLSLSLSLLLIQQCFRQTLLPTKNSPRARDRYDRFVFVSPRTVVSVVHIIVLHIIRTYKDRGQTRIWRWGEGH